MYTHTYNIKKSLVDTQYRLSLQNFKGQLKREDLRIWFNIRGSRD